MFKFLRKYNKMLLAIFGVLLMITFLIPQAFNRFSQQAAQLTGTVATVGDGEKVSAAEWSIYQRELQVLDKLQRMLPPLPGIGSAKTPEHWFLLVREASDAGLVPVMDMRDVNSLEMQQLMAATQERDPEVINRARAHYAGVSQLLSLYGTGDLYSDRHLRSEAERLLRTVTVSMVILQPDPAKSDLQPTEQQIQEQMKKYADKLAGAGDKGFGYKLPDRVKLEWLKVPSSSVRAIVENSEAMDGVQQRLHWKRNPNKNLPPYPTDGGAAAIPDTVRTDLLSQLTKAKLGDIAKYGTDTLRLGQRGLPEKDGYYVLPADWDSKRTAFPQLAEELRNHFTIALPEYSARGDKWLTIDEVGNLPGIGRATSTSAGANPVSLTDMLHALHEFGEKNTTIMLQKGVAGPVVSDAEDNLYFFRVTDVDASREPASVDEVREQVVKDLKRESEYQRLKSMLADLETKAKADGLVKTALDNDTVVEAQASVYLWSEYWVMTMLQYRMPLTPQPSTLPVLGQDRKTIEAIVDFALKLPTDKPLAELSDAERMLAVASDDKLAVALIKVESQQPLSKESFDRMAQAGAIQQLVAVEESDKEKDVGKAFALDTLTKRNKFALKRESGEQKTEDANGKTEPTKTASVN